MQYNGFGGKIEPGETIKAAAVREMHEESGVTLHDATYTGGLAHNSACVMRVTRALPHRSTGARQCVRAQCLQDTFCFNLRTRMKSWKCTSSEQLNSAAHP
ncbi:MAG: NUDIX domain-containing protein [Methanosarcinales archaeon]|nr:MAG: NUDIX domain-containing protein [Methanosarcinales archaeon]